MTSLPHFASVFAPSHLGPRLITILRGAAPPMRGQADSQVGGLSQLETGTFCCLILQIALTSDSDQNMF